MLTRLMLFRYANSNRRQGNRLKRFTAEFTECDEYTENAWHGALGNLPT